MTDETEKSWIQVTNFPEDWINDAKIPENNDRGTLRDKFQKLIENCSGVQGERQKSNIYYGGGVPHLFRNSEGSIIGRAHLKTKKLAVTICKNLHGRDIRTKVNQDENENKFSCERKKNEWIKNNRMKREKQFQDICEQELPKKPEELQLHNLKIQVSRGDGSWGVEVIKNSAEKKLYISHIQHGPFLMYNQRVEYERQVRAGDKIVAADSTRGSAAAIFEHMTNQKNCVFEVEQGYRPSPYDQCPTYIVGGLSRDLEDARKMLFYKTEIDKDKYDMHHLDNENEIYKIVFQKQNDRILARRLRSKLKNIADGIDIKFQGVDGDVYILETTDRSLGEDDIKYLIMQFVTVDGVEKYVHQSPGKKKMAYFEFMIPVSESIEFLKKELREFDEKRQFGFQILKEADLRTYGIKKIKRKVFTKLEKEEIPKWISREIPGLFELHRTKTLKRFQVNGKYNWRKGKVKEENANWRQTQVKIENAAFKAKENRKGKGPPPQIGKNKNISNKNYEKGPLSGSSRDYKGNNNMDKGSASSHPRIKKEPSKEDSIAKLERKLKELKRGREENEDDWKDDWNKKKLRYDNEWNKDNWSSQDDWNRWKKDNSSSWKNDWDDDHWKYNSEKGKGKKGKDDSSDDDGKGKKGRKGKDDSSDDDAKGKKGKKGKDDSSDDESKEKRGKKGKKGKDDSSDDDGKGKKGKKGKDDSSDDDGKGKKGKKGKGDADDWWW